MPSQTTGFAEARAPAWPELGVQGVRFIVVGIAATATHVLMVVCLMEGLGLQIATVANAIALVTGSAVSYLGNYFWTFRRGGPHLVRIARFVAAYGTVFSFNAVVMLLLADIGGISYVFPLALIVAATPIMTFLLNRFWVFA
jgi:putative flippase GtrA